VNDSGLRHRLKAILCADASGYMAPQRWRNDPKGVEHTAAHAQESDVQCEAELERFAAACADQFTFGLAEGEERLQLEAADVARKFAHAQVCRLPALHPAPPSVGQGTIRRRKVNSNIKKINDLRPSSRAVAGLANRH
jgi:hypothetical protein